eukprot:jgi/Pico_ML_1/56041/g1639.t1
MIKAGLLWTTWWTCCFCFWMAAAEDKDNQALNRAAHVAMAEPESARDSTWAQIPNAWFELTPEDIDVGEDRGVCGINSLTETSKAGACRIRIAFPRGRRVVCSGWIIGRDTVATAGHCVYNKEAGGYARQIYVDCGEENPCQGGNNTYNAVKWVTTQGWIENGHEEECSRFSNDGAAIKKTASGSIACPSGMFNRCGVLSSSTLDGCAGMSGSGLMSSSRDTIVGIYAAQRMGFICANYYAFLTEGPNEEGVDIWDLMEALE